MAVPKPPAFDAQGWTDRLKELLPKRLDGTTITVWNQLPAFVKWLRALRDSVASHDVQLKDLKKDIDIAQETNAKQNQRLTVLEGQSQVASPFPE